ncbi:conserved hypothetical protein [Candidatus Koribacter versatilis Ellin345]|uniref:DUF6950 domain-containing protein n=1 Tax=Koribacter versatilis (strain Ellin345) TaxID=204669 RepID=Q1ILU2_KORVE|nr:hypothetical protein [Candidatus Koribacter versatilis]ABF42158.1 conserved hypothetical protein [Candidatus Koribacter versatilis Ellin345]
MKRLQGWPEELARFLRERAAVPFAWGKNDCALFACDAVMAITGVDMAADFRGRYNTKAGATKAIRRFAGGGLDQLADKIAAQQALMEVTKLNAQRGDVVLFDTAIGGPTLGIVGLHGHMVHSVGPDGDVVLPLRCCRRAWRIS